MKSDRKPPLVKSPLRLRPRRLIRSGATTPLPGSSSMIRMQSQASNIKESPGLRPEYRTISCEIKALQRMVQEELGKSCSKAFGFRGFSAAASSESPFQKGKHYDAYCAKRNERLKRKLNITIADENQEPKTACNVGVSVETAKKEATKKRATTARKPIQMTSNLADRSEHPRYSLRSIKKPPLPIPMNVESSVSVAQRKTRLQRARAI